MHGSQRQFNHPVPVSREHHLKLINDVLTRVTESIPLTRRPDLSPYVNWGAAHTIPIHRWFRYREAFSPHLITQLELGHRLLDPFCGCGSIMVGAAQLGREAVGLDVNPLAVFVAKVKLTPLSDVQRVHVRTFAERFNRLVECVDPWPVPKLSIASKVFEPDILDVVLRLRTLIEQYSAEDAHVRDFLLLAWIAILEEVGSYFKEGNGIKYRNKKRLKTGYIRRPEGQWQQERFGADQKDFVIKAFANQLGNMIADTTHWCTGMWSQQHVMHGDARQISDVVENQVFDSIIFSPPYANRFDYFESLKVELWFGGFVNSYDELNSLRKQSLRSHLGADLNEPGIELEALEQLINLMDRQSSSWRMGVPLALRGYFDDMYRTLLECRKLLTTGTCSIVVGNSAFAGVIIPTDLLIAQLGLKAGFSSAKLLTVRHLTVAPQQRSILHGLEEYMRESIVVLQ
jgi:site-specific DNA-methyltransferase (adenine-specific)